MTEAIEDHLFHGVGETLDAQRIKQDTGISDNLGHGRRARTDHWYPTRHRLEGWEPEAFVERGKDERIGATQQGPHLLVGSGSNEMDLLS